MEGEENICRKKFIIGNKLGLHARPAAMFVKMANMFNSDIWVKFEGDEVNGKSIMGLMMLAAPAASELEVSAEGEDSLNAVDSLGELIEGGFEED